MITKFEQYNEGIKHLLVGPTKEESWDNYYKDRLEEFIDYLPETPEEFFDKMKEGIYPYNSDNRYYWLKNGTILFSIDYDKNWLLVDTRYIWYTLDRVYGLNDDEIRLLIKKSFKDSVLGKLYPVTAGFTEMKFK